MARRERTTGLPRPAPRKARVAEQGRFAGIPWDERTKRWAILGPAVVVLLVFLGVFAYRIYEERVGRPNSVILSVDGEDFTLQYYADRLGPYAKENAGTAASIQLLEEDLLSKLEREAVTIKLAEERGIALDGNAVLDFIAGQLGVPRGGANSAFDNLYRNQLRQLGISDGTYRRLKKAELADSKLLEQLTAEVGTAGTQITLRSVLLESKEKADATLARIQAGENIGDIAQTESLDLESRQQDGLMLPEPIELLPENVRKAMKDKNVGDLLGPVEVQSYWWIFKIERQEPTDYSDAQKSQLAQGRLDDLISTMRQALRSAGKIHSDLSADDVDWAESHVTKPSQ